jgi:hypothetical protein
MKFIQETRHAHYVRYLQFCYYGELGRFPLSVDIKQRMVSYWTKLISDKQTKLCSITL